MARTYLLEGYKFRQDNGNIACNAAIDLQAAHTTRTIGTDYVQDVIEALGQVALLCSEYCQLSEHWHTFLGFGIDLPPRDPSPSCRDDEANAGLGVDGGELDSTTEMLVLENAALIQSYRLVTRVISTIAEVVEAAWREIEDEA